MTDCLLVRANNHLSRTSGQVLFRTLIDIDVHIMWIIHLNTNAADSNFTLLNAILALLALYYV